MQNRKDDIKNMSEYEPKAKPTMIHFVSRASVKIKDNFYTVEYGEDRQVDYDKVDIVEERKALIETCNLQVDSQIEEILKTFTK